MSERNERPIYDGSNRRVTDRRKGSRRKTDKVAALFKYLIVIIVTALIIKAFGF